MSLTHRVGLRLDNELYQELVKAAKAEERTPSSLIRLLVRQHLERKLRVATELPKMISTGQSSALHAKDAELNKMRGLTKGASKQMAMTAAAAQFKQDFTSSKELTFDQCSWVLDYLEDQIAYEKEQAPA